MFLCNTKVIALSRSHIENGQTPLYKYSSFRKDFLPRKQNEMPKLNRTTNICDHCRQYHHQRIPYEPFPYGKKEGVKKCTFCPSKTPHVLCESCYQNSQLELSGSVLQYL